MSPITSLYEEAMMKNTIQKLWKDESAQGATEYILMLVIVVGIAMLFKDKIRSVISGKVDDLSNDIQGFNTN
jgi:Flp pilus assembly pilin Flp